MGTVEPIYNLNYLNEGSAIIVDDALAFIYGAINKYGAYKKELPELKEYILKEAEYIGK